MNSFNALKKMAMEEMAKNGVEPRIKYLVDTFNSLPGIFTTSSCGGHEVVDIPTQSGKDGFNIDFVVSIKKGGWESLKKITAAAWITGGKNIDIRIWYTPMNTVAFSIEGKNNASPDLLASVIS